MRIDLLDSRGALFDTGSSKTSQPLRSLFHCPLLPKHHRLRFCFCHSRLPVAFNLVKRLSGDSLPAPESTPVLISFDSIQQFPEEPPVLPFFKPVFCRFWWWRNRLSGCSGSR